MTNHARPACIRERVLANEPTRCRACGRELPPGTSYERLTGFIRGTRIVYIVCLRCAAAPGHVERDSTGVNP